MARRGIKFEKAVFEFAEVSPHFFLETSVIKSTQIFKPSLSTRICP
jgi:hypothetical protein